MSSSLDHTRLTDFQKQVLEIQKRQGIDFDTTYRLALGALSEMISRGYISKDLPSGEYDSLVRGLQQQFRSQPIRQKGV